MLNSGEGRSVVAGWLVQEGLEYQIRVFEFDFTDTEEAKELF